MGIWSQTSWAKPKQLSVTQLLAQDIKARIAASKRKCCDVFSCQRPVGRGNTNWRVIQYDGVFILICPTCQDKLPTGAA